jgi:septum formation protein
LQVKLSCPDEVVTAVIAKGDILQCAGGFMIDKPLLFPYLERFGTRESVIGFPVHLLLV